jgi:hypothetical protein
LVRITGARDAAQQNEPAAVLDLAEQSVEHGRKAWQGKDIRRKRDARSAAFDLRQCGVDFLDRARVEAINPRRIVLDIASGPRGGPGDDSALLYHTAARYSIRICAACTTLRHFAISLRII